MFDLSTLKSSIVNEHKLFEGALRASLDHARNVGTFLLKVKEQLKGKGYVKWVESECPFSYSCADNYVKVAANWDKFDPDALSEFTLNEFLSAVQKSPKKRVQKQVPSVEDGPNTDAVASLSEVGSPTKEVDVHRTKIAAVADGMATPAEVASVHERSTAPAVAAEPPVLLTFPAPARIPSGLNRSYVFEVAAEVGIEPEKLLKALELLDVAVEPGDAEPATIA